MKKIRVLLVAPTDHPKISYLEPTMKALRKAVSAGLEEVCDVEAKKLEANIYVIFNKERFLIELLPNRRIDDDIISGTFYVIATDGNSHPTSLTDEKIQKYMLRFWNTEDFSDIDVIEANINSIFSWLDKFE